MKTPSLLHPLQALRGLRTLALAAITVTLLGTGSALAVDPLLVSSNTLATDNGTYFLGYKFQVTTAVTAHALGTYDHLGDGLAVSHEVRLYDASQNILASATVTTADPLSGSFRYHTLGAPLVLPPGDYFVCSTVGNDAWVFEADTIVTDPRVSYLSSWYSTDGSGNAGTIVLASTREYLTANVALSSFNPHTIIFQKGDAVPGVAGATFTGFGTPSINESGTVAFLGKWTGTTGSGTGIFAAGALVVKVGDEVVPASGVKIKSMKDPVLDDMGRVAFPAALIGTGISATNDSAIVSNASGGTLAIVAQEGTQAADAPVGALWKSFASTAAPGGGGGVLILGFMAQGAGGITAANDNGLWSADGAGALHLLLQEGTTAIGAKTVKSFAVLKALSGTPGQTHAHNTNAELVSKVTFTDGFQAIVHTALP